MRKIIFVSLMLFLSSCEKSEVSGNLEKENYIVVFKKSSLERVAALSATSITGSEVVDIQIKALNDDYKLSESHLKTYSRAVQGGLYRLSDSEVKSLRRNPDIQYIEKDGLVSINAEQRNPAWGLDRIDQSGNSLDSLYKYKVGPNVVNAYIIDTGIRVDHQDFEGRAQHGIDTSDDDNDATDCNGHGTHVAGTVGGTKYGVAKSAVRLIGVRVLNCMGSGRFSDVIDGIEWVTKNHRKPAVANMSLGGGVSQAIDDAIQGSVAAGVTYVVAAGNSTADACNSSPARSQEAITVGSTTINDERSGFSNYGKCVDIFAPGSEITSAWHSSATATRTLNGTSMASPHVAGAVALYLSAHPNARASEVKERLLVKASANKLKNILSQSPNLLLNTEFLNVEDTPEDPVEFNCPTCTVYIGQLAGAGSYKYEPNGSYFVSQSGKVHMVLESSVNNNFVMLLYRWSGQNWQIVSRKEDGGALKELDYRGVAGYYALAVLSRAGSGSYKLWRYPDP